MAAGPSAWAYALEMRCFTIRPYIGLLALGHFKRMLRIIL